MPTTPRSIPRETRSPILQDGETLGTSAALYAFEGKHDEAFAYLNRSLEHAPRSDLYDDLATNANYNALHSDPRFAEFLAKTTQKPLQASMH